jgi:hypothetical protein
MGQRDWLSSSHLGADEPAGFQSSGGTTYELFVVHLGRSRLFFSKIGLFSSFQASIVFKHRRLSKYVCFFQSGTGLLSFLITLSAIAESQRGRQVATGFEDLYFL